MAAIFHFSLIRTTDSLRSSLVVSSYIESMGIGVWISFLSCIEAEICVISHQLPVNGSHLWFIPYSFISHSCEYFSRVAQPRKRRYNLWNFIAIVYGSRDIRYFVSTSGNGSHLWFLPYPHIWHSWGQFVVSPDLKNMGIAVGISLLSCIVTELHLIPFFQPPSWIYDFRFLPTVFLMVPLKSLPSKT